jgi:hypothetical protein
MDTDKLNKLAEVLESLPSEQREPATESGEAQVSLLIDVYKKHYLSNECYQMQQRECLEEILQATTTMSSCEIRSWLDHFQIEPIGPPA